MLVRNLTAVAVLIGLVLSMVGGYWLRGVRADRDLAAHQLAAQTERAQAVAAALRAAEQARQEEERRAFELERIARDASLEVTQAREAAAAATDTAGRLREHVARLAAQCAAGQTPGDSGIAAAGPPAAGPGLVLANMLGGLEGRGRELAAYADQARVAGAACERAYDALTINAGRRP